MLLKWWRAIQSIYLYIHRCPTVVLMGEKAFTYSDMYSWRTGMLTSRRFLVTNACYKLVTNPEISPIEFAFKHTHRYWRVCVWPIGCMQYNPRTHPKNESFALSGLLSWWSVMQRFLLFFLFTNKKLKKRNELIWTLEYKSRLDTGWCEYIPWQRTYIVV